MEVQGKFKMQAHSSSGVVMDIAAFKVGHSADKDATALQAARTRSSSIGALDESLGKVQEVNTHAPLGTSKARRANSVRQWMKAQRQFKRQAHSSSLIGVHVALGHRCRARAVDDEPPALPIICATFHRGHG